MKKMIIGLLSTCAVLMAFADYTWINQASSTAATPHSFVSPANWDENGVPPSGAAGNQAILFPQDAGPYLFVNDVPDGFKFYSMKGNGDSPLCLLGTSVKTVYGFNRAPNTAALTTVAYVYADILQDPALYFNYTVVCGDIASGNQGITYQSGGSSAHRLDLYAKSSDPVRVNPGSTYALALAWGTFNFVAPQGSDVDIVARWTLTNGSPFARRAEGQDEHVLCAGTIVTAADGVLPAGTFLKRLFPDGTIELSNAATLTGASSDVELTFAKFSPVVRQKLDQLNSCAECEHAVGACKWREKDDVVVELRSMGWKPSSGDPSGESLTLTLVAQTGIPAKVVVTDVYNHETPIIVDRAHLQLDPSRTVSGVVPGFPKLRRFSLKSATSQARITVTNGITAYLAGLTKIVGAFRKDGAGTLIATFGKSRNEATALLNTGSVAVEEGTMEFDVAEGCGLAEIQSLSVKAGARIQLSESGLHAGTFAFEPGAVVSGPGVLSVDGTLSTAGLVLENGATVAVSLPLNTGKPVYDYPKGTAMVGHPALWFDAAKGLVSAPSGTEGVENVSRWNDCRGDGYLFATNVASVYPTVQEDECGRKFVKMTAVDDATPDAIEKTAALVWSVPLTNIRAVFSVEDAEDGAGSPLGSTQRLKTDHYCRENAGSWYQVVDGKSAPEVRAGKIYFNGERIPDPTLIGFPYYGYSSASESPAIHVSCPLLYELHPTGDTAADAIGFNKAGSGKSYNGGKRLYELVVFTNELSTAERLEVAQYLMKKNFRSNVHYERLGDVPNRVASLDVAETPAVSVPGGTLSAVDSVSGAGTFEKVGAGELYLDDLAAPDASVKVLEGTLSVRSVLADADHLPATPFVHLDASDEDSMTVQGEGDARTVTEIRDRRGDSDLKVSVTRGTVALKTVPSLGAWTVADLGPYATGGAGTGVKLKRGTADARSDSVRTTVAVLGTAQGGGYLTGETSGSRSFNRGGLLRDSPGDYTDPIISDDNAFNHPRWAKSAKTVAVRTRLNGTDVSAVTTGFSGGYDLVSFALQQDFTMSGLCACQYGNRSGGQELGEQIFFEDTLSREQVMAVESYLKRKWYGTVEPSYRGAELASLEVAAGATVRVFGNSPLQVAALSGAGTVEGAVALADAAVVTVRVAPDGSCEKTAVGDLSLGTSLTVAFTGDVRRLTAGDHVILESPSVVAGMPVAWTVTGLAGNRFCTLKTVDGAVVATVTKSGSLLIVR